MWGVGTALGELPPYLVAYSHAKAGEVDEEYEELMAQAKSGKKGKGGKESVSLVGLVTAAFQAMSDWMIEFLEHNGFWGVLLFSSYPNALFDMCGMCCGHAMMPMWKFLVAVSIGKGFIKAPCQELLFVWVFSHGGKRGLVEFAKRVLDVFHPLPSASWETCSASGLGAGCTPGGLLLAAMLLLLARHTSKMPKMQLVPLVLSIWGAIFIGLSAGSVMQHQLQLVDKMDKGLDKVLSFCEIGATTAPTSKGWVETIMSYLSPKALFGYFVTGLIL